MGCSPWGRSESDTTERLHFPFSLSCIGEGNGNPLQWENPKDRGAWWAAVYLVSQSRTPLKRLSSSSSIPSKLHPSVKSLCDSWATDLASLYFSLQICDSKVLSPVDGLEI